MERQGRHEKLGRREQLIKSLFFCVSFHVASAVCLMFKSSAAEEKLFIFFSISNIK